MENGNDCADCRNRKAPSFQKERGFCFDFIQNKSETLRFILTSASFMR